MVENTQCYRMEEFSGDLNLKQKDGMEISRLTGELPVAGTAWQQACTKSWGG